MIRYDALPQGHRVAGRRFLIDELIGRGRSSAVYRALDFDSKTSVALKILDPFLAQDPVSLERFAREVRIIRKLNHPNVVRLYSFFQDGDFHVICMEYIEGLDGAAYLDRYGRLSVAEFLPIAKTSASAVASCHRMKVLHRDLKPQNLLLTPNRDVKLVDFGVSKINTMSDLTKTGTVIGTPEYMAPEQFNSTTADPRSDVYSLGAVFYQLLTERPPYAGTSLSHILGRQLSEKVEPIATFRDDVPEWLEAVVGKCLRTDRGERYQSCYELLRDLEQGEQALARQEQRRQPEPCLSCREPRIAGLPFCHQCGTLAGDVYERGDHALILYQCDDKDTVSAHLARAFRLKDARAVRARLERLPVLLLRRVSEATAAAVANDLASTPCELTLTDKLPSSFRLPRRYLLYGCLALLPMLVHASYLTVLIALPAVAGSELLLIWLYTRRVRPLFKPEVLGRRPRVDPFSRKAAYRLRQMNARDLKVLLGKIVASLLVLRKAGSVLARRGEAATPGLDLRALTGRVEQGLEAARAVEGYELYLSSRSLNDIRQKLDAADLRLRHAAGVEQMEPLVAAKAKLQGELKRYLEVQELHSRLFVALLNLNGTLRRLVDALADRRDVPALAADLADLEDDLRLEREAPA